MADWADEFLARIIDRIETEADAIGVEMVADIRETISIPVEREGGIVILRSQPDEDPRRETGNLWESERHEVNIQGDVVELTIINDAFYAKLLNDGGENAEGNTVLPRPFHEHAREKWIPDLPQRIADAIAGEI